MQYFASHYWQQGGIDDASLVLQQAYHKRKKMPVVLAAVGQKDSHDLAGELVDWYYGAGHFLFSKCTERGMKEIEKHLRVLVEEKKTVEMAGILCVGAVFVIFKRGNVGMRILNTRNNHSCCREIKIEQEDKKTWYFQTGVMQPGVGVLLGNEEFYQGVSDEWLAEHLKVQEIGNRKRTDKYFGEMARYAENRSRKPVSAVFVVAH